MSAANMAELFGVNTQATTRHLGHIYAEGELDRKEGARIFNSISLNLQKFVCL